MSFKVGRNFSYVNTRKNFLILDIVLENTLIIWDEKESEGFLIDKQGYYSFIDFHGNGFEDI